MRYEVQFKGKGRAAYMVTANGVVIHVTHKLYWALGHEFQAVHRVLTTLQASWTALSVRTDKPRHGEWMDYTGTPSQAVIEDLHNAY